MTAGTKQHDKQEKVNKVEKLEELFKKAPKAQLHLHLDGSLSYNFIKSAMEEMKADNKDASIFEENWEPQNEKEMIDWFINTNKQQQLNHLKAEDGGNWKVFDVCNKLLQTKKNLTDATYDLITRLNHEHHVNYAEIRFAPVLHTANGLTETEVCSAVIDGVVKAKDFLHSQGKEFYGGIILCALRSFPAADAVKVVKLIESLNSEHVIGFDIAGDEGSYCLSLFEDALRLAKELGIKITVHAGEWNEETHVHVLDGLKLAVDIGVNRIGHGIALRSFETSHDIFVQMKAKDISIEICLTSNCDNKTKCTSFDAHPLKLFVENNLSIASLNVDNLMLAGDHEIGLPTPTREFLRAFLDCKISGDEILNIIRGSYQGAFLALPERFIEDSIQYWKENVIPHLKHD